jgi:DNA-binding response OmpR family regulator
VPVLLLRHGAVGPRSIAALDKDQRVEVLHARGATPDWVALGQRVAGTVIVTDQDPLAALTFGLTAGLRAPIAIGMHKRHRAESRDLLAAGASACLTLPLSAASVTRLVKLLRPTQSVARMDGTLRLLLDPITRVVRYRNKPVQLSQREFTVLHCLSSRHGKPVSAQDVMRYVWTDDASERSRQILDVYICHLRRKLARVGLKDAITTLRGYGYTLTALADPQ